MTDPTIEVYEHDNATLAAVDPAHIIAPGQYLSAMGMHVPLYGAGELVLPRYVDGAANPALALIRRGRLVRFTGDFTWTMEIEDVSDVVVAENDEAGEVVTIRGRDWLTARLAKAHVQPDMGYDTLPWSPDRPFGVGADRLRDDDPAGPQGAWPFAVATPADYDDASPNYGRPEGYVNTSAEWVWSEDSSTSVPGGVNYFRQRDTFAAGEVWLEVAADDVVDALYFDDVMVLNTEGVYKGGSVHTVLRVSAGEHLIAAKVTNLNALKAGVTCSWWTVSDGKPDTLIGSFNSVETRVLAYPSDPPGFTPTEVLRLVVDEEQDRGGLPGLGFSFISASDSNSAAVTEVTDLSCRAPDTSQLTFFQLLHATYLDIDYGHDDLEVDAYIRGTEGTDKSGSVVFEKGTALKVQHDAIGMEQATVALVTGNSFAPFEVTHADEATLGRSTVPLNMGDASKATATRWAAEYLDVISDSRRGIAVELPPGSGLVPVRDFDIGDTAGVLESGASMWGGEEASWGDDPVGWSAHRIASWGFELNATSVMRYPVELDQPASIMQERLDAIMRRFLPGGAGGRTILPSPTNPPVPRWEPGSESTETWSSPESGTVVLRKNGTAITGASLVADGGVTLTDAARKCAAGDVVDITIDGVAGFTPFPIKQTTWLQEMRVASNANGTTITLAYI